MLALDDFGTGYSNLRCLSDLKPAYIKIDRSFTLKALNREYEYRLLNHIVEMSHSLGLHVCVEGIETEGELTKAKQTEPDYIQGFLFGKPCSRAEFTQKFFTKQARIKDFSCGCKYAILALGVRLCRKRCGGMCGIC